MHIGGAHLHSHMNQPSVSTASIASKHAQETRKKLFAAAEELDAAATAESAWMIGAWSGGDENGKRHGGSGEKNQGESSPSEGHPAGGHPVAAQPTQALSELALEQSASAGAQAWAAGAAQPEPASGYAAYAAGRRVERTAEARQVSYWA
ncbi:MAG TPA: hypothetical protein VL346_05615 [Acidobacteriaceae bacterium]|nr:hypothetical protein [Acidobacteriaceae bacterium]